MYKSIVLLVLIEQNNSKSCSFYLKLVLDLEISEKCQSFTMIILRFCEQILELIKRFNFSKFK